MMDFGEVRLAPGVQTELTQTLNTTGIFSANLIRWKQGLVEKIGGWVRYYLFGIGSIPRDLHPWQDLDGTDRLGVGATQSLDVITDGVLVDITPQTTTTNTPPDFATTTSSATVTITDTNISNMTTNNAVFIRTPVAIGGLVLFGLYPITAVLSTHVYQITASSNATETTGITNISAITNANPGVVTTSTNHGLSNGDLVYISGVTGMTQVNGFLFTVAGVTPTTFQLSGVNTTAYGVYTGGGTVNPAVMRQITVSNGSAVVQVVAEDHGLAIGGSTSFLVPTTVGGVVIQNEYIVQDVVDANDYTINAATTGTSTETKFENSGNVQFLYYIAVGPQPAAQPYGSGVYGGGTYGVGNSAPSGTGTPITANDWTQVNWGEILLACPQGGGIYQWRPNTGFQNAQLVATAPSINAGIFIAMPYQILIAYGSSKNGSSNPLQVSWCTIGDYTDWVTLETNTAGNYQIPSGSEVVGGLSVPQQQLLWTDIELWSMQFISFPNTFGFSKIMGGCGLIGSHAMGVLGSTIYWMSQQQFFKMAAGGAPVQMPCSVWDFIFQNLDTANAWKIRCSPNSLFNTISWQFPSLGGSGENDKYVEFNEVEGEWTTGEWPTTGRSAWCDQSLLGPPIGGTPSGLIYQHEMGYDADGAAMNPIFTTGYFVVGKGEEFAFIDQFIPDFKWGLFGGAQNANIQVTINVVNYPGDTPRSYGPYTVTAAKQYVSTRLRGRQVSLTVQSADTGSFWRLGLFRYRYARAGRR